MAIKLRLLGTAIAVSALASFAAPAQAALVSCPASFTQDGTAKVHDGGGDPVLTAASDCQYDADGDNNDIANLETINALGFFGMDWESNGQNQIETDGQSTGTWSILNPDFEAFDYMIVFKDGQDTSLIGFLFNELFESGGWDTPFTDPPFDFGGNSTAHDVSHWTIVRSPEGGGTGGEVPEPAALGLFGLGLLGLGMARRRKLA